MARSRHSGTPARPLVEIFDEGIDVVRQDFGEYGYIALVGAVIGALAVLVPGLIGGPAGAALTGPLLTLVSVLVLGTGAAAVSCAGDQLQPDAAGASRAALLRSAGLIRPWVPLMLVLALAGAGFSLARPHLGPVPDGAVLAAPIAFAVWYAFPRSLAPTAYIEQEIRGIQSERLSMAIAAVIGRRLALVWGALLVPAAAVALISAVGGLDAVSGGFVAFIFVFTLPFGAAVLSPIFAESAARFERVPAVEPGTTRFGAYSRG